MTEKIQLQPKLKQFQSLKEIKDKIILINGKSFLLNEIFNIKKTNPKLKENK